MIIAIIIFAYLIVGTLLHFWTIYLQSKYSSFGFVWITRPAEIGVTYVVMSIAWPFCIFVIISLLSTVYHNKLNSKP